MLVITGGLVHAVTAPHGEPRDIVVDGDIIVDIVSRGAVGNANAEVIDASRRLIIPGLIVAAMYKFTYLFIVDKRMDFWQAMQASHAVVRRDYFGFVMFLILALLINVLGFCCFIVGLMVTVPLTFAAITVAYSEIVGFDRRTVDSL